MTYDEIAEYVQKRMWKEQADRSGQIESEDARCNYPCGEEPIGCCDCPEAN